MRGFYAGDFFCERLGKFKPTQPGWQHEFPPISPANQHGARGILNRQFAKEFMRFAIRIGASLRDLVPLRVAQESDMPAMSPARLLQELARTSSDRGGLPHITSC